MHLMFADAYYTLVACLLLTRCHACRCRFDDYFSLLCFALQRKKMILLMLILFRRFSRAPAAAYTMIATMPPRALSLIHHILL